MQVRVQTGLGIDTGVTKLLLAERFYFFGGEELASSKQAAGKQAGQWGGRFQYLESDRVGSPRT